MRWPLATSSRAETIKPSHIAVVGLLALMAACGGDDSVAAGDQAPDAFTPLVASVLAPPRPVLGADAQVHLVYELFVINPTTSVMRLAAVETLASSGEDQGRVLARVDGPTLDAAIKPLDRGADVSIGPSQVSRVFLDLVREPNTPIPPALVHRFVFTLFGPKGTTTQTVESGFTTVSRDDSAVVLAPPLAGGRWLVGIGCCSPPTIHRTATLAVNGAFHAAQRFAIDFVQLDADGRLFAGPRNELSSYGFYGADVLAAAAGVVVEALDDVPDAIPGDFEQNPNPTPQNLLGAALLEQ